MNPGRKLDALVAIKVMGLRLKKEDCNSYWVYSDGLEYCGDSDFSSNMSAAWNIIKHMRFSGSGFIYEGQTIPELVGCENYRAKFENFGASSQEEFGRGEHLSIISGPHAICMAALKAVGHEF